MAWICLGGILGNKENGHFVIHPSFNQTGTRTTRFSCSNPNAQNVGKDTTSPLRSVFRPRCGHVWYCLDYNQIELRIFAHVTHEKIMLDAFAAGQDVHQITADFFAVSRTVGKTINFAIIYGSGPDRIGRLGGSPDTYDHYRRLYPQVGKFLEKISRQVSTNGFVETLGGYKLYVSREKPYAGVNYIVQGTAGDILKNAMVSLVESERWLYEAIILTIHDEIILELPKDNHDLTPKNSSCCVAAIRVKMAMESAGADLGITTPVDVSLVTKSWAELREVTL